MKTVSDRGPTMKLPAWATRLLARWVRRVTDGREPDFVIRGSGNTAYLRRWWVLPRNSVFNIYAHEILRSDDDRALHDHPWLNVSIVLEGYYVEVIGDDRGRPLEHRWREAGDIVARLPTASHRLELINDRPCRTLFITGPRVRVWGFWCEWGWRPWQDFVAGPKGSEIGRGCE
jgi:hypothetical protein